MAKFKGNTIIDRDIDKFIKKSNESARIPYIEIISNDNLIDNPNNGEDISETSDLENSIKEIGFIDPIEVTKTDNEKFIILSGHRRRVAGVKTGLNEFPCIVLPFTNENDIQNYALLANSHRDSSKDPLLFCKRYKMHEAYLDNIGFNGKKVEEIAKRLGISKPQAERYNYFNQIILPIWELVRTEKVGMSSVLPIHSFTPEKQEVIYQIFLDVLKIEESINREKCELIIKEFKNGKSQEDILQIAMGKESSPVIPAAMESVPDKQVYVEPAQIADDDSDDYDNEEDVDDTDNTEGNINDAYEEAATILTDNSKQLVPGLNDKTQGESTRRVNEDNILGKKLEKSLEKISSYMDSDYKFSDEKTAKATIGSMLDIVSVMVTAIQDLAKKYNAGEYVTDLKTIIKSLLEQ